MKRFIAMTAVLSMLFSSVNVFAQNNYSDINAEHPAYEHIMRLIEFEFVSGYDDGTFKPENYITRAETAKLVCVALNADGNNLYAYFSDVPYSHWATGYVSRMVEWDFAEGYDDGTFRPENNISYNEFIKIFVHAVGYECYVEGFGGYPDGYLKTAAKLGLTDGMVFEGNTYINRADAMTIMDRALDVPLTLTDGYEMNEEGVFVPTFDVKDGVGENYQTLLTRYHNIYTVEGDIEE